MFASISFFLSFFLSINLYISGYSISIHLYIYLSIRGTANLLKSSGLFSIIIIIIIIKQDKYLNLARELKKTLEHESDVYTNCNWCSWYSHQRINKGTRGLGNKRTRGNHPNYCIIEIGQNIKKSPGDVRRLTVTQTPVKNHQLTLMWKTLKD